MTKIKLTDEIIILCESLVLESGTLKITTKEKTVEELAGIFQDKQKTSYITLLTESGKESGFKTGFTSFAGITYNADGTKTVELFQPKDITEARISSAEGAAHQASVKADAVKEETQEALEQAVTEMTLAMASMLEMPAETTPEEEAEADV